ncbi:MAG: DciA family protein [bacterium]
MKKYSSFSSLSSLISKYSKNIDLERGLRETALKNIWADIVGDIFKENTKLMGVKTSTAGDTLLLTAKSSVVCQEFLIHKHQILKKIAVSAYSLGFNVTNCSISAKYWTDFVQYDDQYINQSSYNVFTGVPTLQELNSVVVPDFIIASLLLAINKDLYPDDDIRSKIYETALKDIKTQVWRKNKGFPSCRDCGITVTGFKTGDDILCPSCKYNS